MVLPNPVTTFRDLATRFRDVLFRRDDKLLRDFPQLVDLLRFLGELERRFDIQFARQRPLVHSNVTGAAASVRAWLDSH